jgi:hypothetical protein
MNKNKEHLLALDYFNTKINQAQKDIELFSVLIAEIQSLQSKEGRATLESKFIKLAVSNKGEENESN